MSREEVQISDIEPSVIGEDVTRYAIQIRGVDGNGNEGPWSTILEYESPELLPSLESNNYVEGLSGWRLDNDGTFEVNDGLIRGTLQSANYIPNVAGWALDVNGNVEFSTGTFRGAIKIGQNTFNVDAGGNLFIGGSTFETSPFAVNTNGQIAAMSINGNFIQANTIAGNRLIANTITADQIAANYVYAGTLVASQITSGTFDAVRIPNLDASKITAGTLGANVVYAGAVVASQIVSGTIDGARVPNLDAAKITSGTFDAVRIPNLSADKITTGTMSAARISGGTITGVGLNILSGAINGLTVGSVGLAGSFVMRGTINQISGGMTLGGGTITGNLTVSGAPTAGVTTANLRWNTATDTFERISSSIRYKKDVTPCGKIERLLDLSPVTFYFKTEEPSPLNYGLIAEDVDALGIKILVDYMDENREIPENVDYSKIGLALIPYVKELYDRIEQLEEQLNGS